MFTANVPMNADEEAMSDVDAIRTLARERDLEFVDLDAQTVDISTAEVLPEAIALRLHVVAIKWESGIPVIAVANPDDIFVLDTIRASVGRDFTLVVAPLSRSSGTSTDSTMRPIRPGRQRRRVPFPMRPQLFRRRSRSRQSRTRQSSRHARSLPLQSTMGRNSPCMDRHFSRKRVRQAKSLQPMDMEPSRFRRHQLRSVLI